LIQINSWVNGDCRECRVVHQEQAASGSHSELGHGPIGSVVYILTGERLPDLCVALEQAGYRTVLCADFESVPEEPNTRAIDSVALVDTKLLQAMASFKTAAALAAAMPLALLTWAEPGSALTGLNAIPAMAALPFPPDPAVLVASLPYWRQRHHEFKALREVEHGLQLALVGSRSIGNAVGMLAERHGISLADAFTMIRGSARTSRQRVEQVVEDIIDQASSAAVRPATPGAKA
jgi:AmiR/NasT family two-component response regulator